MQYSKVGPALLLSLSNQNYSTLNGLNSAFGFQPTVSLSHMHTYSELNLKLKFKKVEEVNALKHTHTHTHTNLTSI